MDGEFGIRAGEIAITLPEGFDAGIYFIGRIGTPWTRREECPKNGRETDAVCTIAIDPVIWRGLPASRVARIFSCCTGWTRPAATSCGQVPRHYGEQRGTFALRSPARPNPIAASVVRLMRVDGPKLLVVGLDCLDGTPLIDLKPYFASTDAVPDAMVGWHAARRG